MLGLNDLRQYPIVIFLTLIANMILIVIILNKCNFRLVIVVYTLLKRIDLYSHTRILFLQINAINR